MEKLRNIMLYYSINKDEYYGNRDEINESNVKSLMLFSIMTGSLTAILFIISCFFNDLHSNMFFYLTTFIVSGFSTLSTTLLKRYLKRFVPIIIYVYLLSLYFLGIAISVTDTNQISATFIAILIFASCAFLLRPISSSLFTLCIIIAFCIVDAKYKSGSVLTTDITNVVVFGVINIFLSVHMTMVKADRIASLKKVKILSEIDILTGAKNRNCFEKNLVEYNIRECSSIAFIYIDVNGLHTMNNKFGHSEGDKMLKTVTREIIKEFGSQDTYRIGGDEFVVFAFDKEAKEISVLLQLIKINLEKNGYYISTGFSIHKKDELNIDKIVLEAEQEMYKEKENYYKLKGEDVR